MVICISGPESTGKTTLALALRRYLSAHYVPEYARQWFADKNTTEYDERSLLEIARGQWRAERKTASADEFVVLDTDLINIRLWSEYRYGHCHPWILKRSLESADGRFYLLAANDIPWTPDALRENPNRSRLLTEWHRVLADCNADYALLKGLGHERTREALKLIALRAGTSIDRLEK